MAEANDKAEGVPHGAPSVCPTCGQATDDVAKMSDREVLEAIQRALLRQALRSLRSGDLTFQQLNVIRGVLKDNGIKAAEDEPEEDAALPPKTTPTPLPRSDHYDETEGG